MKNKLLHAKENELPSLYADRLGIAYSRKRKPKYKKRHGQFFTSIDVAGYMSKICPDNNKKHIRILDPGCGTGILAISLIERIVEKHQIKVVELFAFEIDKTILPYTRISLNYLKRWLSKRNVVLTYRVIGTDFVLHYSKKISNLRMNAEFVGFDYIISNPPYFKLNKSDDRCIATKQLMVGQPNIYTLFLTTSILLLKQDGIIVFIIPRSFCSGTYFRKFRQFFFSEIDIQQIHVFKSRKDLFARDNVLQENIILMGNKRKSTVTTKHIIVSSSINGDFQKIKSLEFAEMDVIGKSSKESFLYLPLSKRDEKIMKLIHSWSTKLVDLDLKVSTGPVVPFRGLSYLQISKNSNSVVPLLWMQNVKVMKVEWPLDNFQKPQYISNSDESKTVLIPCKDYILLRRFSTKDDKRRLIAAPFLAKEFDDGAIGIENHLNYIYSVNTEFNDKILWGLSALLNSDFYDSYIRIINGNTNISIPELTSLPLPEIKNIQSIGTHILKHKDNISCLELNDIIISILGLTI